MPSCRGHAVPLCRGHAPTLSPRRRGGSPRHSPSSRARSQQAAARGTFSTKTPSCRLRREQVNNLLFTQIRLPYVLKDGMQPVCFLTQDSHNEIKVSCCPRIRAPEMQQIHEQKRIRSLQQIEAIFIQTKCTHSRKIPDYNFSIWIPHNTRIDLTRYATWILTCSHRCHGDALRMSYAMNNHDVIAFLHFVHG